VRIRHWDMATLVVTAINHALVNGAVITIIAILFHRPNTSGGIARVIHAYIRTRRRKRCIKTLSFFATSLQTFVIIYTL